MIYSIDYIKKNSRKKQTINKISINPIGFPKQSKKSLQFMNQATSSIQQPTSLTQKQFTGYIKPLKNETLQKIITNWLSNIDLKYFQGTSHNYKQHQPLQYKLKFPIQKILPLPQYLLTFTIPYIIYNKFPFLISDLTAQQKLQKNITLKQIYTNQFYNGKWKQQFNFQFTMIFLTKVVSCFIKEYFVELKINQNLEAQIFIILYKVFLGNQIGLKTYGIVAKKYVEKVSKKMLKNREMASNIGKKKDSMITLYNNNINSNSKGYCPSNKLINNEAITSANNYSTTKQKIIINQTLAVPNSNTKNKLRPPSTTTLNPKPLKSHKNIDLNPNNIKRRLCRNRISFMKSESPPQKSTLQIFNQQLKQSLYIDPLPVIQPKKIDIDQFVIQKQLFMKSKHNLLKEQTSPVSFDNFYNRKNTINNSNQPKSYSKQRSNKISSSMQIQLKKYNRINQHTNSNSNFHKSKQSLQQIASFSLINQINKIKQKNMISSFSKKNDEGLNTNQIQKNIFEERKINFSKLINPSTSDSMKSKYYCLMTTNQDRQKDQQIKNKNKKQKGSFLYQKFDLGKSKVRPQYKNKHKTSSFFMSKQQKEGSLDESCSKNRNTQSVNNNEDKNKFTQQNMKKPMEIKLKSFFKASKIHDKQNLNTSSLNLSGSFQSKSSYLVRKPSQDFLIKRQDSSSDTPFLDSIKHEQIPPQKDQTPIKTQPATQPHNNNQIIGPQQQSSIPITNEKPQSLTKTTLKRKQSFTPFKQINSILNSNINNSKSQSQTKDSIFARMKTQNLPINDYIKIDSQTSYNQSQDINVESIVENILTQNAYQKLGSYTRTTEEVSTTKLKKKLNVFKEFQNQITGDLIKKPFRNITNININLKTSNKNSFQNPQKTVSNKNQSISSTKKPTITNTTPQTQFLKPASQQQKLSKVLKLKQKKQQFLSQCQTRDLNLKMDF